MVRKRNIAWRQQQKHHFCMSHDSVTKIPASMDWRKTGVVTPIKDQGKCCKNLFFTFIDQFNYISIESH